MNAHASRRRLVLVCLLAAILAAAAYWVPQVVEARSPHGSLPTHPPFEVDAHGRVIPESLPDRIPILDENGNVVDYNTREEELAELQALERQFERSLLPPTPEVIR